MVDIRETLRPFHDDPRAIWRFAPWRRVYRLGLTVQHLCRRLSSAETCVLHEALTNAAIDLPVLVARALRVTSRGDWSRLVHALDRQLRELEILLSLCLELRLVHPDATALIARHVAQVRGDFCLED